MPGRTNRRTARRVPEPLDALLVAAGRADALAFAELYDAVAPRVLGLATRVIGDRHRAEEVAHDVFLETWRTATHFDPSRSSALVWMMTLTHQRAVGRVRARRTPRQGPVGVSPARTAAPSGPSTPEHGEPSAQSMHPASSLQAAMSSLPPEQLQALELAFYGGHTHLEVSRLMNIAPTDALTHIAEGLQCLSGTSAGGGKKST